MIGQCSPNDWARIAQFSQCLGNGCPMLGQRLPNGWAMVAQGLGNGCPIIGQRLPNNRATVVQGFPLATFPHLLGNDWARFGQWLPNTCATVAQCLIQWLPKARATVANNWQTVVENLGSGFPINPCEWGRQSKSWGVHHFRPHRCSGPAVS